MRWNSWRPENLSLSVYQARRWLVNIPDAIFTDRAAPISVLPRVFAEDLGLATRAIVIQFLCLRVLGYCILGGPHLALAQSYYPVSWWTWLCQEAWLPDQ